MHVKREIKFFTGNYVEYEGVYLKYSKVKKVSHWKRRKKKKKTSYADTTKILKNLDLKYIRYH